jgi:hypothetical protein
LSTDEDGDRDLGVEAEAALAGEVLEVGLEAGVDAQPLGWASGASATTCSATCGLRLGKGFRVSGPARRGRLDLGSGRQPCCLDAGQHALAGLDRAASLEAVGPARLGRLRQGDQQRGFGRREALRLLAEIGEARGAYAFEIAAEGGERQVEIENAWFVEAAFEFDRADACRSLAESERSSRGSSRRATCMVRVEPPETMRPFISIWPAARMSPAGRCPNGCRSACPHRP